MILFLKPRAGHGNLLCIDQVFLTTLIQWGFEVFFVFILLLSAIEKNSEVSNMDLKEFKVMTDLIGMCQIKCTAVVTAYCQALVLAKGLAYPLCIRA